MVRGGQGWSGTLADDLTWLCWCGRTGKSGVWGKKGEDKHSWGVGQTSKNTKHKSQQPKQNAQTTTCSGPNDAPETQVTAAQTE